MSEERQAVSSIGAPPARVLIFDADDTLWENNVYFERAFDAFVDYLDHSRLTPEQVREVLIEIEEVNYKTHGYGSLSFGRNLQQAYQHLAERHISPDDLHRVMALAEAILEQPLELMEGVAETVAQLSTRYELALFTKGHPDEQLMKVDRSGLHGYFTHTVVAREKDTRAYDQLIAEKGFRAQETWMIGNSPKSDINPALEAGLGAVFIPHERTWVLERQEIRCPEGARYLEVERIAHLIRHF